MLGVEVVEVDAVLAVHVVFGGQPGSAEDGQMWVLMARSLMSMVAAIGMSPSLTVACQNSGRAQAVVAARASSSNRQTQAPTMMRSRSHSCAGTDWCAPARLGADLTRRRWLIRFSHVPLCARGGRLQLVRLHAADHRRH